MLSNDLAKFLYSQTASIKLTIHEKEFQYNVYHKNVSVRIFLLWRKFNTILKYSGEILTNGYHLRYNHLKLISWITSEASLFLTSSVSLPENSDINASIIELWPFSPAIFWNKTMCTDRNEAYLKIKLNNSIKHN